MLDAKKSLLLKKKKKSFALTYFISYNHHHRLPCSDKPIELFLLRPGLLTPPGKTFEGLCCRVGRGARGGSAAFGVVVGGGGGGAVFTAA